jgi:IS30 family transposase
MSDDDLMVEVLTLFKQDYPPPPDQISGYLRLKYPHNPERWVSQETIYIYQRIASDPALKRHFRHARAYRKGRGGAKDRRGQIPDRNTKENPPAIVAEKARVGDSSGSICVKRRLLRDSCNDNVTKSL